MGGSVIRTVDRTVRIIQGRIVRVDRVKYAVDVRDEDGGEHSGISWMPPAMGEAGSGDAYLPEVDSLVFLMFTSRSDVPVILGGVASPRAVESGEDTGADFRQNRPVLNEGDRLLSSQDGNFIILRRGGVLELGASQTARRFYLPLKSTIQDFAQNYVVTTGGGELAWKARDGDASHGNDRTPIEFSLDVKEFSQEDPCIKIRLGRILEEDGTALPNAADSARIIASVNIADRFRLWVDREGNVAHYAHGSVTSSVNGPLALYAHESVTARVRGLLTQHYRSLQTTVDDNVVEVLNGSVSRTVAGDTTDLVTGSTTRAAASTHETVVGPSERVVGGTDTLSVTSNRTATIGGSDTASIAEQRTVQVGGTSSTQVSNTKGAAIGLMLQLQQGELLVHSVAGSYRAGVGPSLTRLLGSLVITTNGDVQLTSVSGAVSLKMNQSGLVLKTPKGEIVLDAAGNVSLGPSGPKGAVVTTLTHPVDYVTGAPILGASQVSAGGAPSTTAIPPAVT